MQSIEQALEEVRSLHERITQTPAPEIAPQAFLPIPPGMDPVQFAIDEVATLKRLVDERPAPRQSDAWTPRANVFAGETNVNFVVEIPGVDKNDVTISVVGGELSVRGQRRPTGNDEQLRPVLVEQPWGAFERRFALPSWCTPECISARYAQGLLEIQLACPDVRQPAEVQVKID